jgi:hypothetical protein
MPPIMVSSTSLIFALISNGEGVHFWDGSTYDIDFTNDDKWQRGPTALCGLWNLREAWYIQRSECVSEVREVKGKRFNPQQLIPPTKSLTHNEIKIQLLFNIWALTVQLIQDIMNYEMTLAKSLTYGFSNVFYTYISV